MKILKMCIPILVCLLMLSGCGNTPAGPSSSVTEEGSSKDDAFAAYSSLLAGDTALLNDTQSEIPDFQDADFQYEYACLDLDGDGAAELLVQMVDDPCGYNAVFHFENGQIFCWNSDAVEMTSRDYPLQDGTMVRQYDHGGTRSYIIFRYQSGGETEELSHLFAREELIPEDSSEPYPYYEIDGNEVDQTTFDEQLKALVTDQLLERSFWTAVSI